MRIVPYVAVQFAAYEEFKKVSSLTLSSYKFLYERLSQELSYELCQYITA